MKKLGFVMLFFLSMMLLAGCQEVESSFVVEVRDIQGEIVFSEELIYPEDTDLSLFEIIDESVELDYDVTQWGPYIKGIEGFYPMDYGVTFNYYLGLYVNDEESMIGIADVDYEEDMIISFRESSMLSALDVAIDLWINSFVSDMLGTYIGSAGISQHVVAAMKQLELYGYYDVKWTDFSFPDVLVDTVSNAFKSALRNKVLGQSTETIESALADMNPTNPYDAVSMINAIDVLFGQNEQLKRDELITYLVNNNPDYMDADFAAMALTAVSHVGSDEDMTTYIDDMVAYIADAQVKEGISSWGNANASSTASAILGLIAVGQNPRGESFTVEDIDLVEALMTFAKETGFKYLMTDVDADLAFSTPQAFAALVSYKIYRDFHTSWETQSFNLWNLNLNE